MLCLRNASSRFLKVCIGDSKKAGALVGAVPSKSAIDTMSLPATIPATGLTGPANDPAPPGSYARLIPGSQRLQDRRPVQTRKQPRSLQDDRSVKAEAAPGRTAVSRPDPLRSISSWLPRPDAVDSTTSLAPWVICDIAVFLIASIAISYAQWFLADGMRFPVAATTYSSALGVALLQGAGDTDCLHRRCLSN